MIENMEKKYWNHENYTEKIESSYFYDYVYGYRLIFSKLFMTNIKQSEIVLDAGCGQGRFLSFLEKFYDNKKYIGFDFSKRQIRIAKDRTKKSLYLIADFQNLPFKDDIFDLIFMIHSFHHTLKHKKIISELRRILKRNRFLYSLDPNAFSPFTIGDKLLVAYSSPLERNINPIYLEKLFKRFGFNTELKFKRFLSPAILHFLMLTKNDKLLNSKYLLKFILQFDKLFSFFPINYLSFNLCLTALKR
jgi:ubiquinone/menaquinone biosynthesis C-methylase UbiE